MPNSFFFTVLLLLFSTGLPAAEAPPGRRPNVVLVLADDLGYGDLGCYGQSRIRTPNIDRLAREGMRFTQFYAGSTVCAPSRATLFTGRHTGHTTIRGNGDRPLAATDYTLSQLLRAAGYRVDGIGKWGLGLAGTAGEPKAKGFNQWVGFLEQKAAHDYYPTTIWRYDARENWNGPVPNRGPAYIHDVFNAAMDRVVTINSDFQFFLYLPFTIPHANPELKEKGMQVPNDVPYSAERWPQPEKNKAAMITRLDQSVGRLLDRLEANRIERETIVLFTSDNGPHDKGGVDPGFFQSAGSLRGIKRDLYEGGIRVPMIVWWPGHVPGGAVSDAVWAMWDLMPTLAEVAGAPTPAGLDGISMLPTWLGQQQTNRHEHLYWEFHERGFQQAVRWGDWKGIRPGPGPDIELYDLRNDPGETNNVAGAQIAVVNRIRQLMAKEHSESSLWPTDAKGVRPDAAGAEPKAAAPPAGVRPPGSP